MRLSHARRLMSVRFDDPNLVSCAGLAPVMALAARCGLADLLTDRLRVAVRGGANATAKVLALVAGIVAGADSINDMDLLRHARMGRLFTDVRAPSTLGTFLRCSTFGHVRQLDAVAGLWPRREHPGAGRGRPGDVCGPRDEVLGSMSTIPATFSGYPTAYRSAIQLPMEP